MSDTLIVVQAGWTILVELIVALVTAGWTCRTSLSSRFDLDFVYMS